MTHDHTHHTPAPHTPEPQARLPWYRTWTGLGADRPRVGGASGA